MVELMVAKKMNELPVTSQSFTCTYYTYVMPVIRDHQETKTGTADNLPLMPLIISFSSSDALHDGEKQDGKRQEQEALFW